MRYACALYSTYGFCALSARLSFNQIALRVSDDAFGRTLARLTYYRVRFVREVCGKCFYFLTPYVPVGLICRFSKRNAFTSIRFGRGRSRARTLPRRMVEKRSFARRRGEENVLRPSPSLRRRRTEIRSYVRRWPRGRGGGQQSIKASTVQQYCVREPHARPVVARYYR